MPSNMDNQIPYNDDENIKSHLSTTQQLERACDESRLQAEIMTKDEAVRRLRVKELLLEHENEDLGDQLIHKGTLLDQLSHANEDAYVRLEAAEELLKNNASEMRVQAKEIRGLKIELSSVHVEYAGVKHAVAEKVVLSRENVTLRQELEHLRAQVLSQHTTLLEKLDLERQVKSLEVELALDKKEKRALKKKATLPSVAQAPIIFDHDELCAKIDRLEEALVHEKQLSEVLRSQLTSNGKEKAAAFLVDMEENKPEHDLEVCRRVENLRRDLAREIEELEQARTQINGLEKRLEKEKERRKILQRRCEEGDRQIEVLQISVASEQNLQDGASQKQTKDMKKQMANMETKLMGMEQLQHQLKELKEQLSHETHDLDASKSQNKILESKLEQLSAELTTAKKHLKRTQADLCQTQSAAIAVPAPNIALPTAKHQRKRPAVAMQDNDLVGTPDIGPRGRRPANRKIRTEQTVVGEKSMFSITPFLNRTVNISTDTLQAEGCEPTGDGSDSDEAPGTDNVQLSPSEIRSKGDEKDGLLSVNTRPKAQRQTKEQEEPEQKTSLAEATVATGNRKPTSKKPPRTVNTLAKVTEEGSENEENATTVKGQDIIQTKGLGIVAEEKEPKKKKRKLLGGGARTIFDDDDGEPNKRPLKSLLASSKLSGKGGLAGPKGLRGGLQSVNGFGVFSPLKKDRRGVGASFLG